MQPRFNGHCYNCNKYGHKANECETKTNFEGNCFTCHKHGHKSSEYISNEYNQHNGARQRTFIGLDYNT